MIVSIPYLALLLPETKNVPLEEMVCFSPSQNIVIACPFSSLLHLLQDRLWYTKNVWRANSQVMATLRSERADRQNGIKEEVLFNNPKPTAQHEFVESVGDSRA